MKNLTSGRVLKVSAFSAAWICLALYGCVAAPVEGDNENEIPMTGGVGAMDLWVATRNDNANTFSQVTNLVGLNSSSLDQDPVLSADERELIFSSGRDGRIRLWRSVRDCE